MGKPQARLRFAYYLLCYLKHYDSMLTMKYYLSTILIIFAMFIAPLGYALSDEEKRVRVEERDNALGKVTGWTALSEVTTADYDITGIDNWVTGDDSNFGLYSSQSYPKGQNPNRWNEFLLRTYVSYKHYPDNYSFEQYINDVISAVEMGCLSDKGTMEKKVLAESSDSTTIMTTIKSCKSVMPENTIIMSRYVKGYYGFHAFTYAAKEKHGSPAQLEKMKKTLASVTIDYDL